jgi:tetratricopeptide (TPR) repeat protein
MRKFIVISLFTLSCGLLSAQTTLDSLKVALESATGEQKVKTLNELFRAYQQADPVSALGYTREALNLATEIGDKKGMAASYNNLGVSYRQQGAIDKALEYYINSLKLYEELDNKEGIATLKNNIANIYSIKKDFGLAVSYLEQSYALFTQLQDKKKIVGSMNNLGNLNSDLQLFEKAMRYYSEAYQLSQQVGMKFADPLTNLGNIYFKQGNYQRAVEFYNKALDIEKENNNKLGMLSILTNIGATYTKAQRPAPALEYLKEAEKLAEELQAFSYLPNILRSHADILYQQGKSKEAYETILKYDSLRETIYGEESTKKIAQMELVLTFAEKERELQLLQKEGKIQTLELRNTRLFIVMVILAGLILIGGFNLYYMSNKKKLL